MTTAKDYSAAVALATRLVQRFGRPGVVLERRNRGTADPAKPWLGAAVSAAPTTLTVKAAIVPVAGNDFGLRTTTNDGKQKRYVSQAIIDAASVGANDLTLFDVLRTDGRTFQIDDVQPFKPGDTLLVYALGLNFGPST